MKIDNTSYHKPVLLSKAIEGLNIKPGGIYADLTYGGGGHTAAMLEKVGNGLVVAFDQDEDALKNKIEDERLILIHSNFRFMRNYLKLYKTLPLDGILADLGISSHQIDQNQRGFSTRFDAPLDLRMNRKTNLTASDVLNTYPESKIKWLMKEYGELAHAHLLAEKICSLREAEPIKTTGQLMEVAKTLAPPNRVNKLAAQIFQALRIEVNDELGSLKDMLLQSYEALKTGGRLVVISYHSLEDRMVKNYLKTGNIEGIEEKDFFGNKKLLFRQITRKPVMPGLDEIEENNRARSAKLRIGERI